MKPERELLARLLAIDLGLRLGWAAFDSTGRLLAYGSRHFRNRAVFRKAIPQILARYPELESLVIEGGGDLFVPWEKEGIRRGIRVRQVMGEEWRRTMLPPSQARSGPQAKRAADRVARSLIQQSGARRPTSLSHDAAEAVLVGAWASRERRPGAPASP